MYEHMLTGCCISDEQLVGLDTRQDQVYSTITIISIMAWSRMKQFLHQSPPPGLLVGPPVCISKCCVMFHACTLALIQCLQSTSTLYISCTSILFVKESLKRFKVFFHERKCHTRHLHTRATSHNTCIFYSSEFFSLYANLFNFFKSFLEVQNYFDTASHHRFYDIWIKRKVIDV